MIKSMTGFGRGQFGDDVRTVTVEIRAVNHRFCDIYVKMPRKYAFAEEKLKAEVKKQLSRGKIEINVSVDVFGASESDVRLDKDLARKYYFALEELRSELGEEDVNFNLEAGKIDLSLIAKMPDVIKSAPAEENEEEILNCIMKATNLALADIISMRETEGAKLAEDLLARADIVDDLKSRIETRAPQLEKEYADKFRERIKELLDGVAELPEERVALEAAVFADKANITEELVRLGSHTSQLRSFIKSDEEAVGKKIDFLIQEMNREANTIGSKSNDRDITNMMLELKAEIEKIREQVQNIE